MILKISNKRGSVILVIMVIIGLLFVVGIIYVAMKADKESSKMYEDMIKESLESDPNEAQFGEGVHQDYDIVKKEYKSTKKPKPIIYVSPTGHIKSK